jgi:hypothetical protein
MGDEISQDLKEILQVLKLQTAEIASLNKVISSLVSGSNNAPQGKTPDSELLQYLKYKNKVTPDGRLTCPARDLIAFMQTDDKIKKMGNDITPKLIESLGLKKENGKPYKDIGQMFYH